MENKIKILMAFAFMLSSAVSWAQDVEVLDDDTVMAEEERIDEMVVNTELTKIISDLETENASLKQSEKDLNGRVQDMSQTIEQQNKEIEQLKGRLIFADTVIARISNDCLRHKYDRRRVDEALDNFSKIYSPELQSSFSPVKSLLTNYGIYTQELTNIFTEAENDKDITNPFTGHNVALGYIEKIKATRYYIEAYDKNWTIPYLNAVVKDAIERLNAHDQKEKKEGIHLLELMQ